MVKMEWTDELNTGIDMIDKQHMILMRAINLLGLAVERDSDKELMGAIFDTLADYTQTHFKYEEEMFDEAGFPQEESDAHKLTHVAFVERVVALRGNFEGGDPDSAREVLAFLVDWLKSHIMKSDRDYISYVLGDNQPMKQVG